MRSVSRHLLAIGLALAATLAGANSEIQKIPLAPDTSEPACDPQPSGTEKLRKAIEFFISYRNRSPRAPLGDGYFDATFLESVDTALAAQPDCCELLYFDHEMSRSQKFIDRLGQNFGGFVYINFAQRLLSGPEAGHVYYDNAYYVLDACGNPVFSL
jgi:hypothetical protein